MLLRQGVKAALLNTQKQTQGGCQVEEAKKLAQMKEQNKIREKEVNGMEIGNLSDTEFKTLVNRMLRELIEYSHKIKKEMKDTISGIKKNIQGKNLSLIHI